jgi:hypothetical protein
VFLFKAANLLGGGSEFYFFDCSTKQSFKEQTSTSEQLWLGSGLFGIFIGSVEVGGSPRYELSFSVIIWHFEDFGVSVLWKMLQKLPTLIGLSVVIEQVLSKNCLQVLSIGTP